MKPEYLKLYQTAEELLGDIDPKEVKKAITEAKDTIVGILDELSAAEQSSTEGPKESQTYRQIYALVDTAANNPAQYDKIIGEARELFQNLQKPDDMYKK